MWWDTSSIVMVLNMMMQVREDLCLVHEAYQYFRYYIKTKWGRPLLKPDHHVLPTFSISGGSREMQDRYR